MGLQAEQEDRRLNKAYQALMQSLAAPRKESLIEAQRTWLRYRQLNCALYADLSNGSSRNEAWCLLEMTAQRADELKKIKVTQ